MPILPHSRFAYKHLLQFFFVRAETTTRTDADYVPTTDYGTSGTTMVSADHVLVGALARDEEEQK